MNNEEVFDTFHQKMNRLTIGQQTPTLIQLIAREEAKEIIDFFVPNATVIIEKITVNGKPILTV